MISLLVTQFKAATIYRAAARENTEEKSNLRGFVCIESQERSFRHKDRKKHFEAYRKSHFLSITLDTLQTYSI